MSFLPFGRVSSFPVPVKLSRIQFRLAVELALQGVAQDEVRRQLGEWLGIDPREINVDGLTLDLQIPDPTIDLGGIPVEWVD